MVQTHIDGQQGSTNEIIAIEFARRDYCRSFEQFAPSFLQRALFILVEAPVDTCIERIHKRARENGEHFISEDIVSNYYGLDNIPLMKDYRINGQKIHCIWNEGMSKLELYGIVEHFVRTHLAPGLVTHNPMELPRLRENPLPKL